MRAGARPVAERLGHERGEGAVPAGDRIRHEAEEHVAIRHGQRVRIIEVDLELADAVLVVEGVHAPAEPVHGAD